MGFGRRGQGNFVWPGGKYAATEKYSPDMATYKFEMAMGSDPLTLAWKATEPT
jgi:hypothetical protein